MNMYDSKKEYCSPKEFIFEGKVAYITDVVNRSDCAVFKRGFCTSEVFPYHNEYKKMADEFMKEDKREFLPEGLKIIDLICYGNLKKNGDIFISEWYKEYRLVDCEEFKIYRDAAKRFGGVFRSHSEETLTPFIRFINGVAMFGIYSIDNDIVICEDTLEYVCYDDEEFNKFNEKINDTFLYGQ